MRAWFHPECGQWHVEDRDEWPAYITDPDAHVHEWGTLGRSEPFPHDDDRCLSCGRRYRDLPMSIHEVDPGLFPREDTDE